MTKKRYVRDNYEATRDEFFRKQTDPSIDEVVRYIILYFKRHSLISINEAHIGARQ